MQVSPHEFMRAVMAASKGRFTIDAQGDPVDFWIWFVNQLREDLHSTPSSKHKKSILTKCFQVLASPMHVSGLRSFYQCTACTRRCWCLRGVCHQWA